MIDCDHTPKVARGMCRSCYGKWHYQNNKSDYRNSVDDGRKRREWLFRGVREGPCSRCGFMPEDPCQMDMHHVYDDKVMKVTDMVRERGMQDLIMEIGKCDLLCANCHRLVSRIRGAIR